MSGVYQAAKLARPAAQDRAGTWSVAASGNWRLTFDVRQGEICNLDLEVDKRRTCQSRNGSATMRR